MINIEKFPNGIKFFQNENYKFSKDSIDLAKFCNIKSSDSVLEMCAGSGAISFYAYALNNFNKMYLNELQADVCKILRKNIEINNFQDKAFVIEGDLKDIKATDFDKKFDIVIANPPYYKVENCTGLNNKTLSTHEVTVNLKEVIIKARELIKDKGKFYLCMTADRSAELLGLLYENNFQAKRIKFLINDKKVVYLVLVETVFNGKVGAKVIIE